MFVLRCGLLLALCIASACTVENIEFRSAARGRVVHSDGSTERGMAGAIIQACSVNPISFGRLMADPAFCEKEEIVRSGPDGSFAITAHKEWRLGGLLFGPPHGSGEDIIYTVLIACHKDGFMGHADVKDSNATGVVIQTHQNQAPDTVDSQHCAKLWSRKLDAP